MMATALSLGGVHALLSQMATTFDGSAADADKRPSAWRLVAGLLVAPALPALTMAEKGITHEIWIGCCAALALAYAILSLTGFVRLHVPGWSDGANAMRGALLGMIFAMSAVLPFVTIVLIAVPPLAAMLLGAIGLLGAMSGLMFWVLVHARW